MPTKQQLEQTSTVVLAVMCGKVADESELYGEDISRRAFNFKTEWASLQTPPDLSLKHQEKKEAQLQNLRTRMVEFLARIL